MELKIIHLKSIKKFFIFGSALINAENLQNKSTAFSISKPKLSQIAKDSVNLSLSLAFGPLHHKYSPGGTLVHKKFKFFGVSGTRSLESTNTRGTTKVLGSNMTRTCFFFSNGKYCVSNFISLLLF